MAVKGRPRLPWLLLLVAVTAVLPSDADYTDADIDSLVLNRIMRNPQLKRFPKTAGYPEAVQYGVLILVSQRDFARGNTNIQLSPTPNQFTIDNRYTVQPSLQVAVNYLVARPDSRDKAQREHAEKKLLDNLLELLRTFVPQNGPPGMIILYTRATPCTSCTDAILDMNTIIGRFYPQTRFTVAYSENAKYRNSGMSETENERNRARLSKAGIKVQQADLLHKRARDFGGRPGTGGGHLVEVAKPDRTAPPAFSQTLTLGHSVPRLAGMFSETVGHQDLMDTTCSVPHSGQCCSLHLTQTMCCVDGESGFLEANIIHTLTVCAI